MRTPFKHTGDEARFLSEGYCSFPLLDGAEVDYVLGVYSKINAANDLQQRQFYGVNYSLGTVSRSEHEAAMAPVAGLLKEKLKDRFADYEIMGCVFITKPPHTDTVFELHQDWNYTDESSFAMPTCWVPLCDTTPYNGGFSIVKGSHLYGPTYRSVSLPSARIHFNDVPAEICTDISVSKGHCLAFHQAAFHGSYPNKSNNPRIVLGFIVKPLQAPIVYYTAVGSKALGHSMSTAAFNKMLATIPQENIPEEAITETDMKVVAPLISPRQLVTEWRLHNANHKILKRNSVNEEFIRKGFIKLENVIDDQTLAYLRSFYADNFVTGPGMYVTHHKGNNGGKNKLVSDTIFKSLEQFVVKHLENTRTLIAHFASKAQGEGGRFNFHQDWSIVPEELFGVLHCWIPLQDVNRTNGTLAVLPGSHLLFHNYRSGTIPIRFTPIEKYNGQAEFIEAKAGDVVLYHPALFHGSEENKTETNRLAVIAAFTHYLAPTVYYHKKADLINMHEMTHGDLFNRLDVLATGADPEGAVMQQVADRVLGLNDNDLQQQLSLNKPSISEEVYA